MNTHKILLGALLIKPNLAPYALPDLEIEYFPADLQPVFAALSGFGMRPGAGRCGACARYPEQSTAIVECAQACEAECIRITRETVESLDAAHSGTGSLDPVPESGPAGWQRSNHLCRLAGTLQPDG